MTPRSARPAWAERFEIGSVYARNGRSGTTKYDMPIVGHIELYWRRQVRDFGGEVLVLQWVVRDSAREVVYHNGWTVRDLDGVSDRYRDDEACARLERLLRDVINPKDGV